MNQQIVLLFPTTLSPLGFYGNVLTMALFLGHQFLFTG